MKGLIFITIFLTIFWCNGDDNVGGKTDAEIAPIIAGTICDFCECTGMNLKNIINFFFLITFNSTLKKFRLNFHRILVI